MKANDSLECRNCHSAQSMDLTKQNPRAAAAHERFMFTGREDLHRLPQGHRAHDCRTCPASQDGSDAAPSIICPMGSAWRLVPWSWVILGAPSPNRLACQHQSRAWMHRASCLWPKVPTPCRREPPSSLTSRDTRPEARSFAQAMLEFRRALGSKLEGLARERNLKLPTVLEFEHQTVLENLEPLDALELSRRYAEVEMQALEQELQIYGAAPARMRRSRRSPTRLHPNFTSFSLRRSALVNPSGPNHCPQL